MRSIRFERARAGVGGHAPASGRPYNGNGVGPSRRPIIAFAALLTLLPSLVFAQEILPLKRPVVTALSVTCPPGAGRAGTATAAPQREEANRLASQGEQSALEGNHQAARDLYSQATELDPAEPSFAFRLAAEHAELADTAHAVGEYCRYLLLTRTAADTAPTAGRIRGLLAPATLDRGNAIAATFATGVKRYDAADWHGADSAFTAVMRGDSVLAAAAYDRAVTRARMGDKPGAMRDFSRYLALDPGAEDASAVRSSIITLRGPLPSTGTALALGILPGVGQFYTHQPVLGVVVLAAAGAGVALALQSKTITVLKDSVFKGPFGTTYTQQVPVPATTHPNTTAGFAIAGGATVIGMIEAAIVAHRRASAGQEPPTLAGVGIAPIIAPTGDGRLALGLSLSP